MSQKSHFINFIFCYLLHCHLSRPKREDAITLHNLCSHILYLVYLRCLNYNLTSVFYVCSQSYRGKMHYYPSGLVTGDRQVQRSNAGHNINRNDLGTRLKTEAGFQRRFIPKHPKLQLTERETWGSLKHVAEDSCLGEGDAASEWFSTFRRQQYLPLR
jgi:hypothetical protein